MSSTVTKYLLTTHLADKLIQLGTVPITAITHLGATSNMPSVMTLQNNHEEADTLLVLCAAEIHSKSFHIHLYSSDIDVLVLVLSSLTLLELHTVMIMGTGLKRRHIPLLPIVNTLGQARIEALISFHCLSG